MKKNPVQNKFPIVSEKVLILLAAAVWIAGAINLVRKSILLFLSAYSFDDDLNSIFYFLLIGFLAGSLKAYFIFNPFCSKNLNRIKALKQPKIWQFFSPSFFAALLVMILSGTFLSNMAEGNYYFLLAVGSLDLAIGLALLESFPNYLKTEPQNNN